MNSNGNAIGKETLIEQIQQAFATAPYPGDDNLVSSATDSESADVAKKLRGKDWRQVDGQTIRPYSDGIPLLTGEAFCYYLPAFLLNLIKGQQDEDHNDILAQGTLEALTFIMDAAQRKKPSRYRSDYSGYLPLLTRPQRQTIHDFFDYYFSVDEDEDDEEHESFVAQQILGFWEQAVREAEPAPAVSPSAPPSVLHHANGSPR